MAACWSSSTLRRHELGLSQTFDLACLWFDRMTFSEWLLAYLRGEDVTVCSRNFASDHPFYEFLP